jgi:phasin family protein
MAESPDKAVKSVEQARAAVTAQSATPEIAKSEAASIVPDQPMASAASAPAAARAAGISKPATKKPVPTSSGTICRPRRAPAPKAKPAPAVTEVPTLSELKDKIMATAKTTTDFTKPFADAIGDIQTKAKAAYDKSAELAAEATEFAKGNVEALVESGKVYAAGVQDLSKGYVEEAKSAYETLTADVKELAAVKSPLELFQLQSKLARRNFDAWVAYGSKNADAVIKLASESFAPISGRISLAVEKIAKAA